jgi:plastocyanin
VSARRAVPAAALAVSMTFMCFQPSVLGRTSDEVRATQTAPGKARVLVKDNYFQPRSAAVLEGGRVYWKWRGVNRHNVRFTKVPKGASRKGTRARRQGRWKRTFRRPGVYRYHCRLWAGMRGTVNVAAKPEPSPSRRR